jgi:hypothetical protein
MLGRISRDQGQLFYSFNLEEIVPDDHLVRAIARVLDLSWVRAELAPHYSYTGRPSIDPLLFPRAREGRGGSGPSFGSSRRRFLFAKFFLTGSVGRAAPARRRWPRRSS